MKTLQLMQIQTCLYEQFIFFLLRACPQSVLMRLKVINKTVFVNIRSLFLVVYMYFDESLLKKLNCNIYVLCSTKSV